MHSLNEPLSWKFFNIDVASPAFQFLMCSFLLIASSPLEIHESTGVLRAKMSNIGVIVSPSVGSPVGAFVGTLVGLVVGAAAEALVGRPSTSDFVIFSSKSSASSSCAIF